MLWVDKYRPRTLQSLSCHPTLKNLLLSLSKTEDFPHLLFYGPSGSGKKTRIAAFLREVYGPSIEKLKLENRTVKIPPSNSTSVDIQILSSIYHVEVSPSEVGGGSRDTAVVQLFIKETAQSPPVQRQRVAFKVVVLNDVDRLSIEAQSALRRTMEKYIATCRIIMTCENFAKVLPPIRSRCLCLRVPAPPPIAIENILMHIAEKERLTLSPQFAERIIEKSARNLRRAILLFETSRMQHYPFSNDQQPPNTPWEDYVGEIARLVVKDQSVRTLGEVRGKLYDLLVCCVPADIILQTLLEAFLMLTPPEVHSSIAIKAADFEGTMRLGQKEIFHLEAFVAGVMADLKRRSVKSGR